jgi:hypothetical protein
MAVLGHISLKFHPSLLPSHTLSVLQSAGWQFGGDLISYQHYAAEDGLGNDIVAPVSEWEGIRIFLDTKFLSGEIVAVQFEYRNDPSDVWFHFRQDADGIQEIWAGIQEPRPRLCDRFTDFGWYLPRIVCPLYEAGHNILEVNCNDDAY